MRRRRVVIAPSAETDLRQISAWLARETSGRFAARYTRRIVLRTKSLALAGERGTLRKINGRTFRLIPIMPSISVAFHVDDEKVTIFRIIHGGQDWEAAIVGMEPDA